MLVGFFCRVLGAPQMLTCLERWCLALWPWATRAPRWKSTRFGKIYFLLLGFSEAVLLSANTWCIECPKCGVNGNLEFALKLLWCYFWHRRLLVVAVSSGGLWMEKQSLSWHCASDWHLSVLQLTTSAHAQQGFHSSHWKQHLRESEYVSTLQTVAIAHKQMSIRTQKTFLWTPQILSLER